MGSLGWPEIIAVLIIVLVIFGPKRLPDIGRSLGQGIREFKKSTTELQDQLTKDDAAPKIESTEKTAETVTASESVQASEPAKAAEPKEAPESKSNETKSA